MKMALIGGGGVRTIFFCQSLAKYAARLGINELRIMDSSADKLSTFGWLSAYAIRACRDITVRLTQSVEEAVDGVDYVVTAIRVGGDQARVDDERTALSLGVLGQETTGAGGFAYAARTVPVLLDMMRIIKEKSNNALVFNFTNPSGLVSQAIYDAGYTNNIGICDNATGTKIELAQALQVDARSLAVRCYGLNHLTWADSVQLNGQEILPHLMASDEFVEKYHDFLYYDRGLIRAMGTIPNGYLYYYYHREKALGNILKAEKTRGESVRDLNAALAEKLNALDLQKNPEAALAAYRDAMDTRNATYMATELGGRAAIKLPLDIAALGISQLREGGAIEVLEGYAGVAFNYIDAVQNGTATDLAINVPNRGTLPFLADDDIVEVSCAITAAGAVPVKMAAIPPRNELLIRQIKQYEKQAVAAIRDKSMDAAIMALTDHPLVGSYSLAKQLMHNYKKVHAQWLGDWK